MPQPSALLHAHVPNAEQSLARQHGARDRDATANALSQQTLQEYIDSSGQKLGWWSNTPAYMRSLLQAWYGDAANEEEGNCSYRLHSQDNRRSFAPGDQLPMLDGKVKGYFLFGQNPAAGSTNSRMQRKALGATGLDGRARPVRG